MATEFKNHIALREAQKLQPYLMPLLRKAIQNIDKIQGDFLYIAQQTAREFNGTYNHADVTRVAFALEAWYDTNFDQIKKQSAAAPTSVTARLAQVKR
jgi:hypothetical protein